MSETSSINSLEVGARVHALRESQNESQERLAQSINVSRELITKIERGRQFPSAVVLSLLSEHYCVTTDYLLFGNNHVPDTIQMLDQAINLLKSIRNNI